MAGPTSVGFVQSGGFGNITLRARLPVRDVSAAELAALEAAAGAPPARPRGADRYQYDLTLEGDGPARTATLHEGSVPAALQGLVRRLAAAATAG